MKYDKIVGLKKQQEKENLEIIQREIDAMLRRKERISITTLAKYAGVDRSYFYRNLPVSYTHLTLPTKLEV